MQFLFKIAEKEGKTGQRTAGRVISQAIRLLLVSNLNLMGIFGADWLWKQNLSSADVAQATQAHADAWKKTAQARSGGVGLGNVSWCRSP